MRFWRKGISVLAVAVACGSVMSGTANAGTDDFFWCPQQPPELVQAFTYVTYKSATRAVFMEKCWSAARQAYMFRGNVQSPQLGDELRIYYMAGGVVRDSSRVAPRDVDGDGYMPGEWYLAGGGSQGKEITACVAPGGSWPDSGCTQRF